MVKNERPDETRSWWAEWFNDEYLRVYAHRDVASAQAEIQSAVQWLGLQPGDSVLDLCCGTFMRCSNRWSWRRNNVMVIFAVLLVPNVPVVSFWSALCNVDSH